LEKFDVIVVGAGTAGCLAAKTIGEQGLNACLVERKNRKEIGEKICGDALGEHHLRTIGLENPPGNEFEQRIEGVEIHSPDLETVFTIAYEDYVGYMLNRRLFGQWLLTKALNAGANLLDSTNCLKPMIKGDSVTGVKLKNMKTGATVNLRGKIVLDASGFTGVIRRNLPEKMGIEKQIVPNDVEACYREIRQLKGETERTNYCKIFLNQKVAPGGYTWIFPKAGAKVNAGLGVCMKDGFPNPQKQFREHVLTQPMFDGSLLLKAGSWYDPTRKPLSNMVGDGVAILGDAASLVNPIHGGGIGPSMLSGYLAGKTAVDALEKGNVNKTSLWSYNRKYMELYGAKQAGLDAFRMLLLSSDDEDLNYGMKHELLKEQDILKAGLGEEFRFKITDSAKRVFKGLRKLRFLNKLRLTVNLMKQIKTHYIDYPETIEEYDPWKKAADTLFNDAKSKLLE
jgi:geranylgeranyl reductase family protein